MSRVAKVIWQRPHRTPPRSGRIGTPSNTVILDSPGVSTSNRTSIRSAIFVQQICFWNPWPRKFILGIQVRLQIVQVMFWFKFVGPRSRSHMSVCSVWAVWHTGTSWWCLGQSLLSTSWSQCQLHIYNSVWYEMCSLNASAGRFGRRQRRFDSPEFRLDSIHCCYVSRSFIN